ncbi:MAG: FtsX-like permease family protein, partial [Phycisphaerae bacterium]
QASNQFLSAEIEGLGAFATVVPAIFLIVAALVLNVLLRRLVRQQRVVIGTLKAIGYTDLQVFVHFWEFGLSVGVAGGVLGGLLGHLLSVWMTAVYRHYFEFPELPCGFYWHTHALGMCVSLLCALLGSLHGARTVLRLQPAQAMRPEAPRRGGAILLERLPAFWHLLSAGWRLALRSVFRHRMRTAASVFAATMGAGLLVNGLMLIEGMHFFVDFQFFRVARSDIDVAFKDERGEEALDEVRRLPGVDWAEPLLQVACTFVHGSHRRKGSVTGILRGATLTVPRSVQGQPIRVPDSGVVMSRGLAEILHVAPGALVTMIPVKGERRPVQLVVAKIADSYMGLTVYAEIHYLSRLVGESLAMSAAQLMTDGNARHLRQLYRRLKQTPGVQTVNSRRATIENINRARLQNQWIFIGLLTAFAGVLFFGSIVNASMVNLAERRREVATFRALGYGPWRIGGMFFRENLLTTIAGFACGLPVGYLLSVLTAASYQNDLLRLPVVTAPWVWAAGFAAAMIFALLAQGVVQVTIHRMDFLDALRVQE